jgi:hypothetical protein
MMGEECSGLDVVVRGGIVEWRFCPCAGHGNKVAASAGEWMETVQSFFGAGAVGGAGSLPCWPEGVFLSLTLGGGRVRGKG